MARGIEGNEVSTPKATLKKSSSATQSNKGQRSILGFFAKSATPTGTTPTPTPGLPQKSSFRSSPVPSSDAVAPSSPIETKVAIKSGKNKENGLPSPASSADRINGANRVSEGLASSGVNSPSRKASSNHYAWHQYTNLVYQAKKAVNYVESDEDEDEVLKPSNGNRLQRRPSKRRRIDLEESDDEFGIDDDMEAAMAEAGMFNPSTMTTCLTLADIDDFVVPDDSDDEVKPAQKRKRPTQSKAPKSSPLAAEPEIKDDDDDILGDLPAAATAQQWTYDPENPDRINEKVEERQKSNQDAKRPKEKAHKTDPDKRHTWLAMPLDADRNPPGHPDYDPRTLYIPPTALTGLSAFERQYWEIKCKFMDTIVFFKKGKFYELYENDATVGHQQFDLKMTDRVNMRMVGVPESSLDHWANQFVARGHKIARVDQMENALSKEMREREEKKPKKGEVIRRELASVLTRGTLVDGGMLQDDMATYCVAIKVRFNVSSDIAFLSLTIGL